ncbi:MAG: pilus assembly protein [Actinobacteria bacterium]|nr:pilus assembly protein [Actinomycetota bacterium]MBV8960175.1 pilus assembly protein [Actinomycetota bacterium]MBV9253669.1 pilus assembly protein [Actinomycetota bacterium]MBV9665617.1 pilus assembly protein [Actinomycetota bacterium]MBV9933371.1 pilus assembly protein [Actinomycetota bacterium]
MSAPRERRMQGQRGVVMVEAALLLPVIMMIALCAIDFGLAWRDRMRTETAVRSGARTGSNLKNDSQTDYNVLQAVKAGLADIPTANIDRIVIFNATSSGTVPAACASGTASSGSCNVYTAASMNLASSSFGCGSTAPDRFWCPTSRQVNQAAGEDYIGVWVEAHRSRITGFVPGITKIHATAVMRLEP